MARASTGGEREEEVEGPAAEASARVDALRMCVACVVCDDGRLRRRYCASRPQNMRCTSGVLRCPGSGAKHKTALSRSRRPITSLTA